ncbi:uncharacterized protein PGTG_04998 [Puccinia graminis f. sp. tritici CRL 75-36-700-3]|uniref:Uncharacterized protein n=1 Tax=Puccinia graminis f. sp. tritici (strain CRL 75-36-700-3 / race SCCL) TaxID=418459 RepID=E3K3I5_PUCGT|nr:uncharacterized protein PGTG_04998 [Puccinia graminis f. sp. tritici CRL 75-36-700-3]EFP79042.2 hypothetical protein PGTG_04998 [Puccinia graminis f. sp. tritici CRL 75-36-700-3]
MTGKKVSKAKKGQRRWRRREKIEKEDKEAKSVKIKTKEPKQASKIKTKNSRKDKISAPTPILVDSDSDINVVHLIEDENDAEVQILNAGPINSDKIQILKDRAMVHGQPTQTEPSINNSEPEKNTETTDMELFDFQEAEIEARNQGNDLVNYYDLAMDDETSDEDSDETEDKDKRFEGLWPIFSGGISASQESIKHRQLKSGKKTYQQPVKNPNSSSSKLIPAPIPKQTKHDRKNRRIQALGTNNTILENYFIRLEPVKPAIADSAIDPDLVSATLLNSTIANPCLDQAERESVDAQLACLLEQRLAAPTKPQTASKSDKAQAKWEALNSALNKATLRYQQKVKKDKKFKFPQSMMNNLYQFNNLRLKYSLNGTGGLITPSVTASLAAAQSSIEQHPSTTGPPKLRSGIYLSWSIRREAKHILNNQHLSEVKQGNRKNHRLLLENVELRKVLFTWAASQVAGHVTPITFREHVINKVFPQFDIQEGLSRNAVTRWMIKLGYRPQEYRKCLYFDGHERPDVLKSRKKYIEDFSSYRKQSRVYGGDDLETAAQVDPEALGDGKETVFIFHDESTVVRPNCSRP